MTRTVKLRKMGDSIVVPLPKDLAERFHLDAGDEVYIVVTERGLLITPYDPAFEEAMVAYRRGARTYRNALRDLAE